MIYSGYENGHYFIRFTHDVRVVDVMGIFQEGYRIFGSHMLLVKKREAVVGVEFEGRDLHFRA
jgi:hypothetical protein